MSDLPRTLARATSSRLVALFVALAPVLCLSGCTMLLEPDPVCRVDADCGSGQLVCRSGYCVTDTSDAGEPQDNTVAWVMSYFEGGHELANDSLHLAYSMDGLHWTTLNETQPEYQVTGIGTNHLRDPFILRKQDGTFVLLATDWTLSQNDADYWNHNSPNVLVADSTDLLTFTNPRLLKVTNLPGPGGADMHAWAPEAFWDPAKNQYAILFAGNDPNNRNRIYVNYTTDFVTCANPTPEVFFDPGYSVIDGTVYPWNGRNYLFFKDESDGDGGPTTGSGKDVQIARSTTAAFTPGTFTRWDPDYVTRGLDQNTRRATEGPFLIKAPQVNVWYLCVDFFLQDGVFGCFSTPNLDADPSTWVELASTQFSFPAKAHHASTLRVTQAELDAIIAHYGVAKNVKIRTTYSESSKPFYVAHSWYHGVITFDGDTTGNLLTQDLVWKPVPGLADPTDPTLVSFVVTTPGPAFGRYLRVDASTRYPACDEGSNHGYALCWIGAADRHHLTWVDAFVDTAEFKSDATFRRVPALNGNASMVSLQWYTDTSRYLRHAAYQLFGLPVDGSAQQNTDASFTLEVQP